MKISNRFVAVAAVFVTCLITSNVIAVKIMSVGSIFLPVAVIVFPISYIFGDILTEVYGYRWARRVIWLGFACNLLFVFFVWLGQQLPAASFWGDQSAYDAILGYTPRLLAASFSGYLVGEFTNSFVMSRMKIRTQGRWLWARTIGSTLIGQGLDTTIFIVVAFAGTPSFAAIMILYHWLAKTGIEVVATPLTYAAVNYLKRKEGLDTYDYKTSFNPFALRG